MPTYEYRCLKCKKKFDYTQSMTAKPLTKCIHCKGKVERLIGAGAGLIFKGSGFYITDYKNKKQEAASSKDSSAKAPAEESKPAEGRVRQSSEGGKKETTSEKPNTPSTKSESNSGGKKTEKKNAGD